MFIVAGQYLATYRALFQQVDRAKHFRQSIGAGCGEKASTSNLGKMLKKRQIGSRDIGGDLEPGSRIDTLHHSAGSPNRDRVHRHAEITGQIGGLLWIKWLWDGRLIVAVGQKDEDFSLWG